MDRLRYTLTTAWQYRHALASYGRVDALQIRTLLDLDPLKSQAQGIRCLILDFDGVLSAHDAPLPIAAVVAWLRVAIRVFGAEHLFILSNQPRAERIAYFKTYFPGISFIRAQRPKPFADGIDEILARHPDCLPSQFLLVDDRLLTGILAALSRDLQACYVRAPWSDWSQKPFAELFYQMLRYAEHAFVSFF